MWRYCGHLTGGLGLFGVLTGALSIVYYPDIFDAIFKSMMEVKEGSMSYDMWKELPDDMPMYMKVYYFNCTNHEEFQNPNNYKEVKPLLKQIGPYVFRETHLKENIKFQDNDTVSFLQAKTWVFQEDLSSGSLDDEFYTLNVIAITAAESTRWPNFLAPYDYPFVRNMMNLTFEITGEELFMKTNVRNITFDGIDSPLLTMMIDTPMEDAIQMPFDKFGWFYDRNASATYDGEFEMWTGRDDIQKVGQITRWKNSSTLDYLYPDHCGTLTGSAGEFFPPNRDKTSISIFTTDLCRPIFMNFKEESEVRGIHGYKYWLDQGFSGNMSYNASNWCFNPKPDLVQQPKDDFGEDIPDIHPIEGQVNLGLYNGLLNVSECKFNAPAYVSFPHFYQADPQLIEAFHPDSDFHPNEEEHSSFLSLMPGPGVPLEVSIKMQINFLLRPLEKILMLERVPTLMYPMIWFETSTILPESMAKQLKFLETAPDLGNIIGGTITGVSSLLLVVGVGLFIRSRRPASMYV